MTASRRRFLQTAAAGAAAPFIMRSAAGQTAPNDALTGALIGCGGMGRGDMQTFLQAGGCRFAAVCDVDENRFGPVADILEGASGRKPDVTTDYRRILERNDLDFVLVATPDHWHALPTIEACQAGLDVYVEKPLATTIEEGRRMRDAARRYERVVQMGTQWPSAPEVQQVFDYVRSGKLGKLRQVRCWANLDWVGGIGSPPNQDPPPGVDYDMWLGPAPKRAFNPNRFHFDFRWFWDYAGGLQTDWGVHLLNVCLFPLDFPWPESVVSYGGKYVVNDNSETPDTQAAFYDFGDFTLIYEHQRAGGIGLFGRPHGMAWLGDHGILILDSSGWEVIPEPKESPLEPETHAGFSDARLNHVRNFMDCVKTREQPIENLERGHAATTIAQLGNLSLRSGSQVTWDPVEEAVGGTERAQQLARADYRQPWKLPEL